MMADLVFDRTALTALLQGPQGPVAKDLVKIGLRVERKAKQLAPVDTGRLRSSITSTVGQDSQGLYATVGTNVHYARHIEFGTRFMSAHPFLRPALLGVIGPAAP